MASILKVDELQGITVAGDITVTSEGGAATQSLQQGLAKTWVHINSINNVISVGDSLNTSSITDVQTGVNQINYGNSFSSAETGITVSVYTTASYSNWVRTTGYFDQYSNYHRQLMIDENDNYYDATSNNSTVHGDLA